MKIFFFTTVFAPSVGGIERLGETLCAEFVALGHEVRVATLTPGGGSYPFPVTRKPSLRQFLELLRWCDIHMQANVALKYAWPRFLFPKKFVYQHNNAYQDDDGDRGIADLSKVALAKRTLGISNSHFTASRTGSKHVVLNAYDNKVLRLTHPWGQRKTELVFLGRLVSQKGCDTLLRALGHLRLTGPNPSLTVIGDGPELARLVSLCEELRIRDQVRFVGTLQGEALARVLNCHQVIVVPSRYEEPFGIVALEGLACGCIPVVSERGGLLEATGGLGVPFPNQDEAALARVLKSVLETPEKFKASLADINKHLEQCSARNVAQRYLEIFRRKVRAA